MDELSPTDRSFSAAPGERPIPDWAPYAVPTDDIWRELQRRRNIIRILRELTNMARDEGYSITAALLAETTERAKATLIRNGADQPTESAAQQAAAIQALQKLAATTKPRRRVQIKPFQLRVPASE